MERRTLDNLSRESWAGVWCLPSMQWVTRGIRIGSMVDVEFVVATHSAVDYNGTAVGLDSLAASEASMRQSGSEAQITSPRWVIGIFAFAFQSGDLAHDRT